MNMFGFHRHSLSLKLGVTITAFIALLFVSSVGLLYIRSRQLVKHEALERAEKALDKTTLRVSCYLSEIEAVTENLKWIVSQSPSPDSLLVFTRRIVTLSNNIDGCSVTMEPDFFPPSIGRFSAYTVRKGDSIITQREGDYDYYSKVWYRTPKEQQRPCWIDPYNDYNAGTLSNDDMIVSYCLPLTDKTGRFIGVISTDLSQTWLSKTIDENKPYPHSYCTILGRDDRLPDISGEPCYVFQKILHQTGWQISLICPERDILGSYKRLGYIIFTVLTIGLILLLIFFMRSITRFVSPLNQLVSQSQYIASGHFGEPMARTRRTDLVGQLQNSFSTMQESLAEQIGQLQQANERAEERNRELLRLNNLAQKARLEKIAFLQDVSHQIRTPLNIIQGFLNVVLKDNSDLTVREKAHIMTLMQKNAYILRRMAYMLYDATWLKTGQKLEYHDLVSCNAVARKAIDTLHQHKPFEDDTVIFETSLDNDIQMRTSETQLYYIIHELLYNAKKFAPDGPVRLMVYEAPAATVNFAIEDEGPGIPEEERQQIFNHFFKHSPFSEGLGLGLYLCRHYCRLLGGDLIHDTTYEKGSRFIIRLPLTSHL